MPPRDPSHANHRKQTSSKFQPDSNIHTATPQPLAPPVSQPAPMFAGATPSPHQVSGAWLNIPTDALSNSPQVLAAPLCRPTGVHHTIPFVVALEACTLPALKDRQLTQQPVEGAVGCEWRGLWRGKRRRQRKQRRRGKWKTNSLYFTKRRRSKICYLRGSKSVDP